MNGSITIVTNVVSDIVDRLDAVAAEIAEMEPPVDQTFLGASGVQAAFELLVDDLTRLGDDLESEVGAMRSQALAIRDVFFELDQRLAAAVDLPAGAG